MSNTTIPTFTSTTGEVFNIVNNRCEVQSLQGYECLIEVQIAETKATTEMLEA